MNVTCIVEDYSNPPKARFRVHSHWSDGDKIEIETQDGERYTVKGSEMISAIRRCMLDGDGE